MSRRPYFRCCLLGCIGLLAAHSASAQQERTSSRARIDVEHYVIDVDINPRTQALSASVQVRFVPLEDNLATASFELNNALNVTRIVDEGGKQIPASRSTQDNSLRLSFPTPLAKGKPVTLTFTYDGRLNGTEDSPVYGIKFAAIHPDYSYLLYPARWFPVNDYTVDRYTADLRVTVPAGNKVISSGDETAERAAADKAVSLFRFTHASFPGSLSVVKEEPVRVASQGVTTTLYFRERKSMAQAYGEEAGKVMAYLTSVYGTPPRANLTLVETEAGTPSGYSAPGIIFLSPKGIGDQVGTRLLANQISRQWWSTLTSPSNRNHIWLQNGNARYAELLYIEHTSGPQALELEVHDTYVEALTVDTPPVIQAGRLEDYSPEYWAVTASKGAAVLNMLRWVIGDDPVSTVGNPSPPTIFAKPRKPFPARTCNISSSNGWSRAAPPSSKWTTRSSARKKASVFWARSPRIWIPSVRRWI